LAQGLATQDAGKDFLAKFEMAKWPNGQMAKRELLARFVLSSKEKRSA
jgi:hypothetical protein